MERSESKTPFRHLGKWETAGRLLMPSPPMREKLVRQLTNRMRRSPFPRFSPSILFLISIFPWFFVLAVASGLTQQQTWKQALPGYQFQFPRDHASHPEYKIEWWYYTGNVSAEDGRRFGYQVTFFRVGVDARPSNPSRWAVRDLFMTHLAVTDIDGEKYQ